MKRAIIIVLDSMGIGAMPDAFEYGDKDCNTLGHILEKMPNLTLPNLTALGLDKVVTALQGRAKRKDLPYLACATILAEQSKGKDTITGHWEMAGVVSNVPFPVFLQGIPEELIKQLEDACGVQFIGKEAASGTEIIARLGEEHLSTGKPILYTSADSVLQVAAHEEIIPLDKLYWICEQIRATVQPPYEVARVIARPFVGQIGNFQRTTNRRDYAVPIPKNNLLQDLLKKGYPVSGIGKIQDIFVGINLTRGVHTTGDADGMEQLIKQYSTGQEGLIFVNLVDSDMKYGHRRDVEGYAHNLAAIDGKIGELLDILDDKTLLLITADHGCDPTAAGTDHTREYVPLLFYGAAVKEEKQIALRESFADLGATLAEWFGIEYTGEGISVAKEVLKDASL